MTEDPRIPEALRSAPVEVGRGTDPLKYCIFTTIALLGWMAGPFVVTLMATLGLAAYGRAAARGQRRTRCLLRDTRLVVAYLAGAALLGAAGVLKTVT